MASITVQGNVGSAPELRFTKSGQAVLGFSMAENHSRKNQNNEWEQKGTTWWRVSVFGKRAETLAEHLNKGATVLITGTQTTREYETKNGEKGQSLEITAHNAGIIPTEHRQQLAPAATTATTASADPWGAGSTTPNAWGYGDNQ